MKRLLCLLMLCLPLITFSQGIHWTSNLSWEQVKQKAKKENKYIFLDCYTTWCGPCKMMDKGTYVNDSVGYFFNEKFISVKVQFDKTDKDDEEIKSWYADADSIGKKYYVDGYPCFIFFKPDGEIVHKASGYRRPADFIEVAKVATVPGKVYDNEFTKYEGFVQAYKEGKRDYDFYPSMIMTAFKANDTTMAYQLIRELRIYMEDLPLNKRYTKDRIEMWANFNYPTKSRVFKFFYEDGKTIDKIMGYKDYAADFVDRMIQAEICIPFMEEAAKTSGVAMRGAYLVGPGIIPGEADWNKLYSMIKQEFGASYAKRSVLTAQIEWYKRHRNQVSFIKYSLIKFKKYPPDLSDTKAGVEINNVCWEAFVKVTDKKTLEQCIPWIEKAINRYPKVGSWVDTYANLLYKTGKTDEAIRWQEKAVLLRPADPNIRSALEDMKQGKPTHVMIGAIWDSKANL